MNTGRGAPTHLILCLGHGCNPELSQPFCSIQSSFDLRTDKFQRCILRRSPVYAFVTKCQRRSSNTFPIYATSRVAFVKTYSSPGKMMGSAERTLYPPPTAVRSQSDSVQLCLMLRCRLVSEGDFSPSPLKKGPSYCLLSFYLGFQSCEIENSFAKSRPIMEGNDKRRPTSGRVWPCRSYGLDFGVC